MAEYRVYFALLDGYFESIHSLVFSKSFGQRINSYWIILRIHHLLFDNALGLFVSV